ncbi:MAG: LytTR family DNA-binding domain-containing protein [Acholeplasma sp.]
MISIALCDNEDIYLDRYESKIKSIATKLNISVDIIRFSSGESLLFYLEDHPNKFNLIYLDIVMGALNGIETALQIRKLNTLVKIIFLTSSKDFVYRAFDANATNYLIKSLHDDKFETVFLLVLADLEKQRNQPALTITTQQGSIVMPYTEIAYFESVRRILVCHTSNKQRIEYYYKISDLEQKLKEDNFILVHRSFLVNMQYILKLTKTDVYLKNGVVLPVSRNNYTTVKEKLMSYLNQITLK